MIMNLISKYNLFGIFFLLFIGQSYSQNGKDTLRINEVNIFYKNTKEIITPQSLNGKILEQLNTHSVADALRYFAGVQIKDYGGVGGLKTINIRSMGSHHTAVFYDGIQLGNAQNGIIDLGKYSLNDVQEIILYNGQKSEIFQSAKEFSSGNSIYIYPKKPTFNHTKTNGAVRLKLSSINAFNPSIRWEQKLTKNISTFFSGELLISDGKYHFRYKRKNFDGSIAYDTTAVRHNADISSKRLETGFFGKNWQVKTYSYFSNRGLPRAIVNGNFKNEGQRLNDKNHFIQASFEDKISENFEIQLKAKWAYDYTKYTDTTSAFKIKNEFIQREFYFSSANHYRINSYWDINLSADFQYNNLNANLLNFSHPERLTYLVAFASTYQKNRWKILGSILGSFINENTKYHLSAPNRRKISSAIYINTQPSENKYFTINFYYKNIFRMPTFNDLYYTLFGSLDLKPEDTQQYNFGINYKKNVENSFLKEFNLKIDGYFNKVTNKIIASPTQNQFRWTTHNIGIVEILGIDTQINWLLKINNLSINPLISYTYQKARDFSDRNNLWGEQIPYTPWNSGSLAIMTNWKNWGLNYSFIYTGERYDLNQNNISYNYVQPFYTHDISLQKTFNWNHNIMKINIEVNNILNQFYDVILNYPMPGRNYRFGISYNF